MSTAKQNRIEIRSSEEEKREFEEAAALAHMDLSEFIRYAAHLYAQSVRREHQSMTLSKEEGLRFLEALEHPPEPSKKLKEAMARHGKNVKNG